MGVNDRFYDVLDCPACLARVPVGLQLKMPGTWMCSYHPGDRVSDELIQSIMEAERECLAFLISGDDVDPSTVPDILVESRLGDFCVCTDVFTITTDCPCGETPREGASLALVEKGIYLGLSNHGPERGPVVSGHGWVTPRFVLLHPPSGRLFAEAILEWATSL